MFYYGWTCTIFGCVPLANATHIGYADCSKCQCTPQQQKQLGSCTWIFSDCWFPHRKSPCQYPAHRRVWICERFTHNGKLWVYGTNFVNKADTGAISCFLTAAPTSPTDKAWEAKEVVMPAGSTAQMCGQSTTMLDRKFVMVIETPFIVLSHRGTFERMSYGSFFLRLLLRRNDNVWSTVVVGKTPRIRCVWSCIGQNHSKTTHGSLLMVANL